MTNQIYFVVVDIFLTQFFWANLRERKNTLFHFGYLFYYSLINEEKIPKNGRNLYINHLTYLALIYAEDIREREIYGERDMDERECMICFNWLSALLADEKI